MKNVVKNLKTIITVVVFSIIAIASTDDKSSTENGESNNDITYDPMNDADGGESGNYDYEEDLGDGWTLYHTYKPSQSISDCPSRKCNWCGENYYADDIEFEEFPTNIYEAIGNAGSITGDNDNIDFENKKIYSKWTVNCIYDYEGYCSRRCSEKY